MGNRLLPTTTSFKVLNVKCRIADDRKTTSSNTRKIAIAMSVAEMEAGEVDDLIRVPFSGPSGSTFRDYKVRIGSWVSRLQVVARAEDADGKLIPIKSTANGEVKHMARKKGEPLSKGDMLLSLSSECPHPTLMKDMCAQCGMDLRKIEEENAEKSASTARVQNKASIAMVHSIPELKVSSDEAQNLGREDELRLQKHRKLVLLVDLDQTVIHTTHEDVRNNIKDVYHFQLYGSRSPWYHTRIRPKTQEFLKNVSKMFELHVVTFGARLYAHTIASFLDPKSQFFSHRILSRDECFDSRSKTANLSSLFPCGDHMVCIIDDREDVWNFAPNLVHVKPYNFFKNTGDINAPPGSADRARAQQSPPASSLPKPPIKKDEPDDMDKDSGSSSSNEAGDADKPKDDTVDSKGEPDKKKNGSGKSTKTPEESTSKEESAEVDEEEEELVEVEDDDDYLLYLEVILRTIH